jgi:uncharacterized protein (DUF488 family)
MYKLPEKTITIIISLYLPKGFIINCNIFHRTELSPDKNDFINYKKKLISFAEYIEKYTQKLINNYDSTKLINLITSGLLNGKDVAFVCYEKDYLTCHRYFLAKYIEKKYGIEWKEI